MAGQSHDSDSYTEEALESLGHHTELPSTGLSMVLDKFINAIGSLFSWLWVALVVLILANVTNRYVFQNSSIAMEELAWHFYGAAFMIGLSFTLVSDSHVRVDVLYERWGLKTKAWIEFFGILLLLLPFLGVVIYHMAPYAYESYIADERSQVIAGLTNRWIMKYIVLISMILLAIAAFSRLLKCTALLFGFPKPRRNA